MRVDFKSAVRLHTSTSSCERFSNTYTTLSAVPKCRPTRGPSPSLREQRMLQEWLAAAGDIPLHPHSPLQ